MAGFPLPSSNDDPLSGCWFLTGATASGKTKIGIRLAQTLGAEIISVDSMAIYREMDIGTAKPTLEQRKQVVHHLVDFLEPNEAFSVAQYRERALALVEQLRAQGKRALFVGGTPLYLKAMLRGIFEGPPADWEFRNQIDKEVAEHGVEALHERLKLIDPLTAHKLHPHDKRRLIRALEVHHVTGQPISHLQLEFDEPIKHATRPVFALHWDRPLLHARIDERVDRMFEEGLIAEVQQLLAKHGELGHTAQQAVGYREVIEHLNGLRELKATIDSVKARTRQFARRQETWFRSLEECRWVQRTPIDNEEETVKQLVETGMQIEASSINV